eukprot:363697-Chlamydomonas_euryale.AAC.2
MHAAQSSGGGRTPCHAHIQPGAMAAAHPPGQPAACVPPCHGHADQAATARPADKPAAGHGAPKPRPPPRRRLPARRRGLTPMPRRSPCRPRRALRCCAAVAPASRRALADLRAFLVRFSPPAVTRSSGGC